MPRRDSSPFRVRTLRALAISFGLAAACAACGREAARAPGDATPPPHDLLLITVDTFRADRAGCCGHPGGLTPAIDRALRPALLARNAFVPAPLTAVSHATMLTALEPPRHGVRENATFPLQASIPTLASHLASHGVRTAGFIAGLPLESRFGFGAGFATFDDDLGIEPADRMQYAERPARVVVDRVLAWLGERPRGERVFVWAHFFDPHHPYRPTGAYRALPVESDYEREIRQMDGEIGRLLRGIEALGRDPVRAIVSDHGEGLGDHRELTHGILLHDEVMRGLFGIFAPAWSEVAPRLRGIHEPVVGCADLAPTLLEAAGLEPMPDADGTSLLDGAPRDGIYGETYYSKLHYGWSPLLSWRDGRWAFVDGPEPELYDVAVDPGETTNVAADHPDVVQRCRQRIEEIASDPARPDETGLDEETRGQLLALGYVSTPAARSGPEKNPKDHIETVNRLFRGITLLGEGRFREALLPLQQAYRADPANASICFYLASCLRELGERDAAMGYYRRAMELEPRADEARAHLAVLRFEHGDRDEALRLLEEGLRVTPNSFALLMTAGDLLLDVGRAEEARARYERAAEASPNRREPWAALLRLAEGRGDDDDARRLRDRLAELAPEAPPGATP